MFPAGSFILYTGDLYGRAGLVGFFQPSFQYPDSLLVQADNELGSLTLPFDLLFQLSNPAGLEYELFMCRVVLVAVAYPEDVALDWGGIRSFAVGVARLLEELGRRVSFNDLFQIGPSLLTQGRSYLLGTHVVGF